MNCPIDDSGSCCGHCDKKVVVVIATHERIEITTRNIRELKLQKPCPHIVIVCSLMSELEYYKTLGVNVVLEPNIPLGRKWQCGVNVARNINADALIILGSDDLLAPGYIKEALTKIDQGFDFVGMTHWYMDDNGAFYHCHYVNLNKDFPIGSGKVYSKKTLDRISWKIFDTRADRKLDDQGYSLVKKNNLNVYLFREPRVLAVKGKWQVMNSSRAYKTSRNISCKRIDKVYW